MQRNENPAALRRKSLTYLILTAVLALTSFLSIWFVSKLFGEGGVSFSFLTPETALGIAAFLPAYFLFDSLRFYFTLRTLGIRIGFWYIVRLTFINVFVSAITPFASGGGFAQLYFLTRKGVPLGSATAASTIRTLLGVSFFLIAAPVILIGHPGLLDLLGGGYIWILTVTIVMFSVVILFLIWVVTNEKTLKRACYRFTRWLRRKRMLSPRKARGACLRVFAEIRNFNAGVRLFFRGSKKYLVLSVLSTLLFLFSLFSLPLLLIRTMGYQMPVSFAYQAAIIISFVTYFALTPGASGIAEGGFALMFSGSVGEAGIAPLTLLWRSLAVYAGTAVGMAIFYIEIFRRKRGE